MGLLRFLTTLKDDLRFAARSIWRRPTFALSTTLTLALGVGAATAVFSVVDSVLFRPLPFRDADRLVWVLERDDHGEQRLPSYLTFRDWQTQLDSLGHAVDGVGFLRGNLTILRSERGPERVIAGYVTPGFFSLLGTRALIGRTFAPEEEQQGANHTAVLSFALWQRRFGGDPSIVGKQLNLGGNTATVVGVMPRGFAYPAMIELWQPIATIEAQDPALANRGVHVDSRVVARLHSSSDSARAGAAFATAQRRLAQVYPAESAHWTAVDLVPVRVELLGDVRPMMLTLLAAVGLVLLLSCVNVANLYTVHGAGRGRELAIRAALGAGRARIVRQLVVESVTFSCLSGMLGVLFAVGAVALARGTALARLPRSETIAVDGRVLAFAACVSVATAVLASLVPAVRATRPTLIDQLRSGVLGSAGDVRTSRLRGVLVSVQFALALLLTIGAGLLTRSFQRVEAVPLGFDPVNLVAAGIAPPQGKYDSPASALALYNRILEAVKAVPGVAGAAMVNHLPLSGGGVSTKIDVDGVASDGARENEAMYRTVSLDYLRTMRMSLVRGRWFSDADMNSPTGGVVINETMARRYWPGQDPMGRQIVFYRASQKRADYGQPVRGVVLGVVRDVRAFGQDQAPEPELFVPYTVEVWPGITLVVRAPEGARLIPALRRAVLEVDPEIPIGGESVGDGFVPVSDMLRASLAQRRFAASLMGAFSLFALVLAVIGMYGVVAYGVAQRSREIGIRLALGASDARILRLLLRGAVRMGLVGLAIGTVGALALSRFIKSLLFETAATDPTAYAAGAIALVLGMALASFVPARHALRTDPTVIIRGE